MVEVLKRVYAADSSSDDDEAPGSELDDAEVQGICALLRQGLGGVLSEDTILKIAEQAGGSEGWRCLQSRACCVPSHSALL